MIMRAGDTPEEEIGRHERNFPPMGHPQHRRMVGVTIMGDRPY